jgi:hypothetical protein
MLVVPGKPPIRPAPLQHRALNDHLRIMQIDARLRFGPPQLQWHHIISHLAKQSRLQWRIEEFSPEWGIRSDPVAKWHQTI